MDFQFDSASDSEYGYYGNIGAEYAEYGWPNGQAFPSDLLDATWYDHVPDMGAQGVWTIDFRCVTVN
jgi:hypothetical protein